MRSPGELQCEGGRGCRLVENSGAGMDVHLDPEPERGPLEVRTRDFGTAIRIPLASSFLKRDYSFQCCATYSGMHKRFQELSRNLTNKN